MEQFHHFSYHLWLAARVRSHMYHAPRILKIPCRLRCASKQDKEAGILKRARERDNSAEQLEREEMAYEDEVSRDHYHEPTVCKRFPTGDTAV